MREADWGWLAGIVDGEGTIVLRVRPKGLDLGVQVAATDEAMIRRLALFGGKVYFQSRSHMYNQRDVWVWRIGGGAAQSLLVKILPILTTKQEHAAIAIACPIGQPGYNQRADGSRGLSAESKEAQVFAAQRIKELNRRGRLD